MKTPVFFRVGLLWSIAAILLLAAVSPPLQAQDYIPLDGLRVSDGRVQFGFASAGQCIVLSNSSINGVVYTTHTSKWQRRAGSSWVDIPGTERNGLCSYSPTSPGEYRLVAEISINGERGHYSSENTLTVEGAPGGTGPAGTESFSFPDLGGWFATSSGTEETVRVGYGRISADVGSTTPSGIAIFQYRDSQGVLIAEASVPATELIQEGRIFAEVEGPVNTGLAIANPNDVLATIDFYFTDTTGTRFPSGSFELPAYEQIAKFLNQEPFNETLPDGSPVLGTFTFESSVPIAVIAIRGLSNEADEFLMTTLPVAPLSPASEETVYIPHFAAGGGWVTQVILVNPTDSTITGTVGFLGPGSDTIAASPVVLTLDDGSTGSNFDYSIHPRSSQRFTTSNPFGALNSGSVRATPNSGNAAPSGLIIFSYAPAGKTLSESGVPALPKGSGFRVYVEASQVGSINTGLAITNTADTSNTVTLEVTRLDGSLAVAPATLALPPSGQVARFLNDIFSLPDNFFGVLRVTSTADVAIVALRLRVNAKGEIKVTTLAPSNEMDPATSAETFFPHIADSGGWSTQFILFSGAAGQASSGTLTFIDASGQPLDLSVLPSVGTPAPGDMLAPADEAAFNDLFVGKRAATNSPAVYVDFVSPGRFRETQGPDIFPGGYTYRNTGPNTGTVTFNYDDGDRCTASLTFVSTTTGMAVSTCDDGTGADYDWMLVEIPASGAPDLVVQTPSVSDDSPDAGESFTLSATVRNQGNGQSAPTTLRYYRSSDATISTGDTEVGTGAVSGLSASGTSSGMITVTAPSTAATYYYGACIDAVSGESDTGNNCSGAVSVTVTTGDGSGGSPTGESFDLDSDNHAATGITFGNGKFYVVDDSYRKVYAYHASGQRDAASDFDLDSDNSFPGGITFANGRFHVVDLFDDTVYAYHASGQRDAASDFDLDPDNGVSSGITFANGRFHVVDWFDGTVYAYHASGQRDAASDFDLDSDNSFPRGITFANGSLYVVDGADDTVYAYHAGQRDAASDFDLDPDNGSPRGITFANGSLYVVDRFDDKVYLVNPTSRTSSSLAFSDGETATRAIPENIPAGINVGAPVSAVGGAALTYSISGTDARSFDIVPETGQIRTREGITYDYERKNRYAVTVGVDDDGGSSDTIDVTILIGNLVPSCEPPSNIRVNHSDGRLTLRWSPLSDMIGHARVLGYQTEIRRGASGVWGDGRTFLGRNITGMIYADLTNGIGYQVRVRPINAEGDCGWSTPVSGIPTADFAPKDPEGPIDRFGPQPVGTPERNFRFLTRERCRHTSNGQTLDANCEYENIGPDTGRIFLEFDDPSQGSCEITLAYSSLTAGSFIDECFGAGVKTNVPFDREFRMPRSAPRNEDDLDPPLDETDVPRAPRTQEEFDALVYGRDDFIPGLCFGSCIFGDPPEKGVARVFQFDDDGVGESYGDYTYEKTGPSQGVVTLTMRGGGVWTFTLDFEPWGNVRATIVDSEGGTAVWPGTPYVDLSLGAQPVLLPIPPSWSSAIAIQTDVAPEDWEDWYQDWYLRHSLPSDWEPVLFGNVYDRLVAGPSGGLKFLQGSRYEKIGRNRATITVTFEKTRADQDDDYENLDEFQRGIFDSTWVFDLTFTSDGAARFTLTVTKEGYLPTVVEGFVDFTGDGISVDEFPEELLLPDEPPQASGEDVSGVEVATAITASRIGPDDQQVLLVSAAGGNYQPGDWLEPKDGGNQRVMIVGAGQVSAARRGEPSPAAPAQFHPQILKSQATVSAHSSPNFAEAVALLGRKAGSPVYSNSNSAITRLSVVCMQIGHDIPTRGARYFSVPKTAQNDVQGCQRNCVLEETKNIQLCVWKCEASPEGR